VDERYKLFYDTRTGEARLYDLEVDPGETRDVGPSEPLRAAHYRQALHAWTLELARRRPSGGEWAELSREQCENLKVLGYVGSECR
jgi:hypothetical protein